MANILAAAQQDSLRIFYAVGSASMLQPLFDHRWRSALGAHQYNSLAYACQLAYLSIIGFVPDQI